MQVDVLAACHDAEGVAARCSALVERARREGAPVIWVQDHDDHPVGSAGWQLAEPLRPAPDEARVQKTRRDSFVGTDLADTLARIGVTRLVVCGAQTDLCVQTTALSAAVRGFDVTLVDDAHTTADAEHDGVAMSAQQIIAHANMQFAGLRYPGRQLGIARHDLVDLARPRG